MLPPGLYEQVINAALNRELSDISDARKSVVPIDKAEASKVLAQYLADVVQKGLENVLDNGGDISTQVSLANQIVALIQNMTKEADFAALSIDQRAEQLLALLREQDPRLAVGKTAAGLPRPETSIAQSSLFTGAIPEPQMYTELKIVFDDLVVNGVLVTGRKVSEINSLMEYFRDRGYIINLYAVDGKMSFSYSTRRIKELLTTAEKMLEVYTYHKVKELGKFDDVVSSFEIDWEETNVKSEFDCILTKGFRTLFVECKARLDIKQNFYYKIAELKDQFGINTIAVLVADTQEKPFYTSAPVNAMQRRRGNMMDVVTIWRPDEINNIGHTLLKVINGTYASEEDK